MKVEKGFNDSSNKHKLKFIHSFAIYIYKNIIQGIHFSHISNIKNYEKRKHQFYYTTQFEVGKEHLTSKIFVDFQGSE